MLSSESGPALPAELERYIFEITAFLHPGSMPGLMRVARRVRTWSIPFPRFHGLGLDLLFRTEPLIYQMISIYHTSTLYDVIDSMPPALFHNYVRHVNLIGPHKANILTKILTLCDSMVNLRFSTYAVGDTDLLACLGKLPLQRLSFATNQLFRSPRDTDFTHSLFAQITHLEIRDLSVENWDAWSGLTQIPRLTHLAFHEDSFHRPATHVYRGALEQCRSLEVLAILGYRRSLLKSWALRRDECDTDPRFVTYVVEDGTEDWVRGARGGDDFWAIVTEFAQLRASNNLVGWI
ncbi:hypothetical protein B0H13DRAFT_1863745 [Mycena leptocephala]|nr:hypothetical protein B0H13DRAFT_1863745 [Mycena leptocephala]